MVKKNQVKLLIVLRLFTGLEKSLTKKKWEPTGVPTIYKFIEKVDKVFHCRIIFITFGDNELDISNNDKKINIDGLNSDIYFLHNNTFKKNIISKILIYLNSLFKILLHQINFKSQIIYLNNQNIFFASLLKKILNVKIVLRIMGVYEPMRSIYSKNSFKNYLMKKFYNSNFDLSILTQDGSGVELWSKQALTKTKNVRILINGVDQPHYLKTYKNSKYNKILFFGRLEEGKGILEFIEFAIRINNIFPNSYEFIVIGTGQYEELMISSFKKELVKYKHFKRVSHTKINQIIIRSDIYLSLNRRGGLSNANLEVFKIGIFSIILKSDKSKYIDLYTDKLIPKEIVPRLSREKPVEDLIKIFKEKNLRKNIISKSKKLREIMNNVNNWNDRINDEINLIKKL